MTQAPTYAQAMATAGTTTPNPSCSLVAREAEGVVGESVGDAKAASRVSAKDVLLRARAVKQNSSTVCRPWDWPTWKKHNNTTTHRERRVPRGGRGQERAVPSSGSHGKL